MAKNAPRAEEKTMPKINQHNLYSLIKKLSRRKFPPTQFFKPQTRPILHNTMISTLTARAFYRTFHKTEVAPERFSYQSLGFDSDQFS